MRGSSEHKWLVTTFTYVYVWKPLLDAPTFFRRKYT